MIVGALFMFIGCLAAFILVMGMAAQAIAARHYGWLLASIALLAFFGWGIVDSVEQMKAASAELRQNGSFPQ